MDIRNGRSAVSVLLVGAGLAVALGCAGKTHYGLPVVTGVSPAQAKAGDTVLISGTGFQGTNTVSFGGAPAKAFTLDNGEQIVAVLPDDVVTGTIAVVNPAGLANSSFALVVTPVIASIDPAHGPAGTTVTLTGSGFYGVTAVAIGGDTSASSTFTYYDPNTVKLVVGAGAATGPVALTASGVDCASSQTFTVDPAAALN